MTKENLKTTLIVVLLIATVVLARQYFIYKVQVERCAMQAAQLELYSASSVLENAETEKEWEIGTRWISLANQAFPIYPQGEGAQRVLRVCKELPNLEFGSEEYEEVKAILPTRGSVDHMSGIYEAYLTIRDEEAYRRLEEILGVE